MCVLCVSNHSQFTSNILLKMYNIINIVCIMSFIILFLACLGHDDIIQSHTQSKSKAKCLAATRVTRTWRSQDTCAPSRYCVPVLCAISWSRAGNSQEYQLCLALQVWAPEVPPTSLVINETQPVYFAPQYKTRHPFYRWVGWSTDCTCDVFFSPALGFEPESSVSRTHKHKHRKRPYVCTEEVAPLLSTNCIVCAD